MEFLSREQRLVFQQNASAPQVPDSQSSTVSSRTPEDLLGEIEIHSTSDFPEERGRAINALRALVQKRLQTERADISPEQEERARMALAQLKLRGMENEQRSIVEIERELNNEEDAEQKALPASEEQEDAAFFADPAAWFRKQSAEVTQLFKKAASPAEWLKGIAAVAAMLGKGWEKMKDYVASAVGPTIASLKDVPFVGGMFTSIEKFIGERRKTLFAALSDAEIELPLAIVSHARKALDRIEKELSASSKGWNAEKLAGRFVALLNEAGVAGAMAKNATKKKIDEIIQQLRGEVDSSEKLEASRAALDDFGLVGWKDGETKEIGYGIQFSDKNKNDEPYSIAMDTITIGPNSYTVEIKNENTGASMADEVKIIFEPHVEKQTLVSKSKVVYTHGEGEDAETVVVLLSEIANLAEKSTSKNQGSLAVTFQKSS